MRGVGDKNRVPDPTIGLGMKPENGDDDKNRPQHIGDKSAVTKLIDLVGMLLLFIGPLVRGSGLHEQSRHDQTAITVK